MAFFKCVHGKGMVHEFRAEFDVEQMRKHPDYVEITEAEAKEQLKLFEVPKKAAKPAEA